MGTGGWGERTQENEDALIRHCDETFAPDRQRNSINSYFLFLQIVEIPTYEILRRDIRRRNLRIVPVFFCQRIYKNLPLDANALFSQLIENGERKSKRDQKGDDDGNDTCRYLPAREPFKNKCPVSIKLCTKLARDL